MTKISNQYSLTNVLTADTTNGRVGIGTSTPNEKLDVNGAIQFRGGSQGYATTTSVGMLDFYAGLSRVLSFGVNSSTYGGFDFYQATQNNSSSRSIMRITSDGNVGIGTTSPVATLSIPASTLNSQISTGSLEIQSYGINNSWIGDNIYFNGSGFVARNTGYMQQIYFGTTSGIRFLTGDSSVTAGAASNATERMRVTSTGDLLVGTTSSQMSATNRGLIAVNGTSTTAVHFMIAGADKGFLYHNGGDFYWKANGAGNYLYAVAVTNGVYLSTNATSWTANSDSRLKNIISPINNALDKLSVLNPVIYSWKSDNTNKENIGLIAQDVESVFPQVIDTNKDGFLGVRYTELVPVLVAAIKEQQTQINELKALINA